MLTNRLGATSETRLRRRRPDPYDLRPLRIRKSAHRVERQIEFVARLRRCGDRVAHRCALRLLHRPEKRERRMPFLARCEALVETRGPQTRDRFVDEVARRLVEIDGHEETSGHE